MPGDIPNDDLIFLSKVFNLILEEAMIHGSPMGKQNTIISLPFHPIVYRTIFPGFSFMLHNQLIFK